MAASSQASRLQLCLDDHHAPDGCRCQPIEVFRGTFAKWWSRGANSVMTFRIETLLAASFRNAKVTKIVTNNAKDYEVLGAFEVVGFR